MKSLIGRTEPRVLVNGHWKKIPMNPFQFSIEHLSILRKAIKKETTINLKHRKD